MNGYVCSAAPRLASASARSFPGLPSCPLTHRQSMRWRRAASSSARQRSTFLTACLSAVFQPLLFQLWIHSVMPLRTYWLSVNSSTSLGPLSAVSASMTAVSSIRLFVVDDEPPCSSLRCLPLLNTTPHPP